MGNAMKKSKTIFLSVFQIFTIFSLFLVVSLSLEYTPLIASNYSSARISTKSESVFKWQKDGVVICTANNLQVEPQICSDGAGGAIITWNDDRTGNHDIYTQRIGPKGSINWTTNGVAICIAIYDQDSPQICSDDASGAIITWEDGRNGNYDIYVQKINSSGTVQWTGNGVAICTENYGQYHPQICSDGAGGAIITWDDYRNDLDYNIYAQRINSAGNVQWTINGTAICTAADEQSDPQICSDGAGGAIITWIDYRNGNEDIYAQKINSTGSVLWTANGAAVCTAADEQASPQICSDGAGGAIIVWEDYRSGSNYDIYAQRINSTGSVLWTANGVAVCTAGSDQGCPQIRSDGAGGAIIVWDDYRSGSNYDIYAQRINSVGGVQWTGNGLIICTAVNDQRFPKICNDDGSGAIITWEDYRSGSKWDIYAQKINLMGNVQWIINGTTVCTAANNQNQTNICSDGVGGAIITWVDSRSVSDSNIYAQRITNSTIFPPSVSPGLQLIILLLQDRREISSFLLSPLGIGIIGLGVGLIIMVAVIIQKRK